MFSLSLLALLHATKTKAEKPSGGGLLGVRAVPITPVSSSPEPCWPEIIAVKSLLEFLSG